MQRRILLVGVLILFACQGIAQVVKYNRIYTFGNFVGWTLDAFLDTDSTYLFYSHKYDDDIGLYCIRLYKTDLHGAIESSSVYGIIGASYLSSTAERLLKIRDSYFSSGSFYPPNHAYPFFAKYNANLDTIWIKKYVFDTTVVYDAININKTMDGSMLLCGYASSIIINPGKYNYFLMKVDTAGNLIWQQQYGSPTLSELGTNVLELADSTLVFSGAKVYGSTQSQNSKPWILKIDKDGNLLSQKSYTIPSMQYGAVVFKKGWTADLIGGGIGDTTINAGDADLPNYIGRFDTNCNILWRTFFNDPMPINIGDFDVLPTGKIIICGVKGDTTYDPINSIPLGFMSLVDSNGNILWEHTYAADSMFDNYLSCVRGTPDGGYIATGSAWGPTHIQNDWVVKTDSNGCETMNCTLGVNAIKSASESIRIYPSPANENITIAPANSWTSNSQVWVFNMQGKRVFTGTPQPGTNNFVIDTHVWPDGLYILAVQNDIGLITKEKFVIQH